MLMRINTVDIDKHISNTAGPVNGTAYYIYHEHML